MRPSPKLLSAAIALALTASCATTSQSAGIENVDSLVSRVERVHLEVELSKQAVYEALVSLAPLVGERFEGDPATSFERFALAAEASNAQAEALSAQVLPMRNSADVVFETWTKSLDEFKSERMRKRSERRLDATRERFAVVFEAATGIEEDLASLNAELSDLALFLGHDFNVAAVEEIREDALQIRDAARALGKEMDDCMDAAARYVHEAALRGQVQAAPAEGPQGAAGE
ncbi:MAG: DUF2959 family protein [Planctomycetota bacterium]